MNFNILATPEQVQATSASLRERNVTVHQVPNKAEALNLLHELIPQGSEIMTGGSTTLEQIGFVDLLKSEKHPWKNLKSGIVVEQDPVRQEVLRKQSVTAEYFLGSVHAVSEQGEVLVASSTGSQLPSYAFSSENVIWVVGMQKIVPNLEKAFQRVREHVFPLENERMKKVGYPGSSFGKWLIFERENMPNRKVHMVLVHEVLGY